ncbi:MAG: hypothetical protein JST00_45080 [Deltaproteobacteria bacterium]|nr:hypothetical protein [Deltaproteobacteria bacterium]
MLTRELMGLGALAVLWINTLLIAGAAWQQLSRLSAKKRELEAKGVVRGRVVKGAGEGGALATQSVEQTGHGNGESPDKKAILFHDRKHVSEVFGGVVEIEGKEIELPAVKAGDAEVWVPIEALQKAGAYPGDAAFDDVFVQAKRAKGYARTVTASVVVGDEVWVTKDGRFVSTIDPKPLLGRYGLLAFASIVGFFVALAACTVLCLQTPHFGTVSIVGAVLGLAYFITVQPAGTMVRDAVRLPNVAWLRGDWIRKVSASEASSSSLPRATPAESTSGE